MKNKIGDKDVLKLLTSLKNSETQYPKDLVESRRDAFTKQAAAMAVLVKAGIHGNGTGASQTASTTTSSGATAGIGGVSMGKLLETLLVIAIVAEAGVATYVYREKIAEFFSSTFGPKVEQVSSPVNNSPEIAVSEDPTASETPEETVTVTETPLPPGYTQPAQANDNNNNGSGNTQAESTPDPTDDNGLHLGQTKQPSKEPKQNESNDSKDNNKNK
jgi:hypothetical protein